jgi:DDE superfamily endonuclease
MSIETLTESILSKMSSIGKWQSKFFVDLVLIWLRLRGRYSFENLSRQSRLSAVSYRKWFTKGFDFKQFNHLLLEAHTQKERLWAFDPCFISKSGKHTYGLDYFWSGCAQAMKQGLEIAGLALVDAYNPTAFHYHASQTVLPQGESLLAYYARSLTSQAPDLLKLSAYIAVDAYFAKFSFIEPLTQAGLHVITRLRDDAVLFYPYLGPKRGGRGGQRKYASKVNSKQVDLSYFRLCIREQDWQAYEACLYCKSLKRLVKVVLVHTYRPDGSLKGSKLFACTDTSMSGIDLWYYYHLRFQIEFLYRDAKQLLGLNHCQSRQEKRLDFQFNFSLTLISLVKIVHYLSLPIGQRGAFSLQDIITQYTNEHLLSRFFQAFGICAHTAKKNPAYQQLVNYAKIAT